MQNSIIIRAIWFLIGIIIAWMVFYSVSSGAMIATGAVILLAILIAVWFFHTNNKWSHSSQGLAAIISVIALILGGYWFLIERPGVPKIDMELTGRAFAAGEGEILVFVRADIINVGNSAIEFDSAADGVGDDGAGVLKIRLGRIAPVDDRLRERMERDGAIISPQQLADLRPGNLQSGDVWPPIARIDEPLEAHIGVGETERYFFRFLMPCEPGLVLSVTARIPKQGSITDSFFERQTDGRVWITQGVIDSEEACSEI